ncbi:DUF1697 domain-containing protein [Simplicispira lacusdiani]|uniref:DUF1697 domain-containing protein n=1 Tax=Simplicispira lacusdiani TaxID=2213010 RepID=UPI000E766F35|nr:DUF1697 domain-containing protein [Simplicispira lacusdiani]
MTTFIALLRGINVGKAHRVPMAELRALLTGLGYAGVATLLNSGNVVFQASGGTPVAHAEAIARALAGQMQVDVPVIVVTAQELAAIVAACPLEAAADPSRLLVAFAQNAQALSALEALRPLLAPPERFEIGPRAAYLHCAGGILESRAGKALLGRAGREVTTRNWATVCKLQALALAQSS